MAATTATRTRKWTKSDGSSVSDMFAVDQCEAVVEFVCCRILVRLLGDLP